MSSFNADMIQRSHEDIELLCQEMREHADAKSRQFVDLTYEQGVINTLKWLFFKTGDHPADKGTNSAEAVQRVKRDLMEFQRLQAREGNDA